MKKRNVWVEVLALRGIVLPMAKKEYDRNLLFLKGLLAKKMISEKTFKGTDEKNKNRVLNDKELLSFKKIVARL